MKKGVIVILIFCTALLSGCSTAKSKTDVVSEVFSDNETVTTVSITETTDVVTEINDNIEASSADESTGE